MTPLALTGIHTDIGKTIVAAVLSETLGCDYWKPVQAGGLARSDSNVVRELLSNPHTTIHPEAFRLNTAASPHVAAQIDGVSMDLNDLNAPVSAHLLIETAGGAMSPMTTQHTVADVIAHHGWATVLVVQHYLGSISHTLAAIEALCSRGVNLLGLIINGESNSDSEQFICNYAQVRVLARIPHLAVLNRASIAHTAEHLRMQLVPELTPWIHT
ncbi:ATP-dependent dethiobiotin synthetase BioD 1 [Ephemeroptericola cinctiostellae]|uniref:ATP-dependent dethiobiotin synthetase BioD n=1 Tax=Ephemeroptericola cinctiostellae TaxID=2268024 RepID=A0A345DDX0_9BURK|nr:dethiobiotin synthase [Ephemeroptericola cinctiostellae]AXF86558.1 ATP-dependent dethiobiotin synthetase BioD 1 [Ephemeroptericola cinctiostellae]